MHFDLEKCKNVLREIHVAKMCYQSVCNVDCKSVLLFCEWPGHFDLVKCKNSVWEMHS